MSQRSEAVQEALDDLGLSEAPKQRWDTTPELADITPRGMVNLKKAMACIDALDTAAFANYIPDQVVIDQAMSARSFTRGWTRVVYIPTNVPIPTGQAVERAIGISSEPTAQNHYRWLAVEVKRHFVELGARSMAPPLLFRTNGDRPILGVIMKFDLTPVDGQEWKPGASWGLLHEQRDPTDDEKLQWKESGLN